MLHYILVHWSLQTSTPTFLCRIIFAFFHFQFSRAIIFNGNFRFTDSPLLNNFSIEDILLSLYSNLQYAFRLCVVNKIILWSYYTYCAVLEPKLKCFFFFFRIAQSEGLYRGANEILKRLIDIKSIYSLRIVISFRFGGDLIAPCRCFKRLVNDQLFVNLFDSMQLCLTYLMEILSVGVFDKQV